MAFIDTLLRVQRLAYLVQRKATGTPQQLADKLGVSLRTVDNLLNYLREISKVDILYCRERCSYYFAEPVKINPDIVQPLDSMDEIRGGRKFLSEYLLDAEFLRGDGASLYC
jgi:hypothetical protein